jgi:diacylglycerol kinase (ATP)
LKTCIIFNPAARGEKARGFRGFLEEIGGEVAFKPTWAPGAATELAKSAIEEGFENIVAAGGDGTLNEVLNGLAEADGGLEKARLGVLPLGTVNVFAKELGIPETAPAAWQTVLHGEERTIDLPYADWTVDGKSQRRHFAQLAGAGLDAEAIALVDWESKRRFRQLAYVYAGIRALLRPQMKITAKSGDSEKSGELVLVGNGRFYGGKLPIFPEASLTDGKLDVCVFPDVRPWTAAWFGLWLCLGRFQLPAPVHYLQAETLELTTTTGARFELEGDLIGPLPVNMGVLPKALRVIVPPGLR